MTSISDGDKVEKFRICVTFFDEMNTFDERKITF